MQAKKVFGFILFILIILLIGMNLAGCTANRHLKKSKKHYEKAIRLGYEPKADTVFHEVQIVTKEIKTDTVFKDVQDTVYINKGKLSIKYLKVLDSVYISGTCESDTVLKEVPITIQEKVYITQTLLQHLGIKKTWQKILLFCFLIFLVILVVNRLIK